MDCFGCSECYGENRNNSVTNPCKCLIRSRKNGHCYMVKPAKCANARWGVTGYQRNSCSGASENSGIRWCDSLAQRVH
jgi:hypothetical protein